MHVLIPALHRPLKPTGVCRHAANLAQCLADTDEVSQVTLLIGAWQKAYFETSFNFTSPKIKLYPIDIQNSSISRNRWFLLGLPGLADALQPDMIHMSFPFPFLRPLFRAPVVSTIHDLYPYECPENFGYPQVWFNRLFLRQCVSNSDGLICVSQVTLDALKHYFPQIEQRKQTAVVYNYVDFRCQPLQSSTIAEYELSSFLLCVAQHRKNKNLDLLIQAYAQLWLAQVLHESTKLVLVGSPGPETDNLLSLVDSLKLNDRVIWLSALTDAELSWLYKHCQLFVIPSSTEGFCLPLVEALSFSARVVCSDIPIFREIAASCPIYFDLAGEPLQNLANAMTLALASAPSPSTGHDVERLDRLFGKAAIARNLLTFYASLS